jgi:hypothetical protein
VVGRSRGLGLSLGYRVLRRLLELVVLWLRSEAEKEIQILLLRHQLQVLEGQVGRPQLRMADRALLAAFSRVLPRRAWGSFFVTPATFLRWHRELLARRWTYSGRSPGRPATAGEVQELAQSCVERRCPQCLVGGRKCVYEAGCFFGVGDAVAAATDGGEG